MSFNNPSGPAPLNVNMDLVNRNPEFYAASLAGQWNPDEKFVLNNIQQLLDKDKELSRLENQSDAKKQFGALNPEIQGALVFINPDADYQIPEKSLLGKVGSYIGNALLDVLKAPYRFVEGAAQNLYQLTPPGIPYKILRDAADRGNDRTAFESFISPQNIVDAFNDVNQWDSGATKRLEEKYGKAITFLAKGLIDGKKPSEILRSYGELDFDMANAIAQLSGQTKEWKKAFTEVNAYKTNPGNDYTNWANKNHPPKDGGWGAMLVHISLMAFAGEVTTNKKGTKWLLGNPSPFATTDFDPFEKIFGKQKPKSPANQINIAAFLLADPITWLTGGTSRALLPAAKYAEKFKNSSLSTIEKVDELFAIPAFSNEQSRLAIRTAELREARRAKNDLRSAAIRQSIANEFPGYDNDEIINLLTTTKVLNAEEKLVPITDLSTIQEFWRTAEYSNYLINLKVNGGMFYRENSVSLERRTRALTDGLRSFYNETFNGIDTSLGKGAATFPAEDYARWTEIQNYLAKKPNLQKLVNPNEDDFIKSLGNAEKNLKKTVSNAFAYAPPNLPLFFADGFVDKSLNSFRDFTRLVVGDKKVANWLTERFLRIEPDERFNMLYSLYNLYLDKIGFANTAKGLDRKRALLDSIFGPNGFGPVPKFSIPAHMESPAILDSIGGISQIFHATPSISMLNFNDLLTEVYQINEGAVNQLLRYQGTGGLTNNAISKAANKGWAAALLMPDLPWKAAAEEGILYSLIKGPRQLFGFFFGQGAAASKAMAAYTGSSKAQGMIKTYLLDKFNRNPANFVSAEKRKAMQGLQKVDTSYTLPNGKVIKSSELISADELFGVPFEERLANLIIAKYGNKLDADQINAIRSRMMYGSHSAEAMVHSSIATSFANNMVDGTLASQIYGKSTLTEALEAAGQKATGRFVDDTYGRLEGFDRTLVHFNSFWKYFGKNIWLNVDFGSAFIRYNALKTLEDTTAYVDDIMQRIGYKKNPNGKWEAPRELRPRIDEFNTKFGKISELRNAGKTSAEITESIIRYAAAEMYTVFHGSADAFNEPLIRAIQNKIATAKEKTAKSKSFSGVDAMRREKAGVDLVELSPAEIARRQQGEFQRTLGSSQVRSMSMDEFQELTKNFGLQGTLRTDIDFKALTDAPSFYKKYKNIPWEAMDRTLTDVFRSDAYSIVQMEEKISLKIPESDYAKSLIKKGVSKEDAYIQADIYFTNLAEKNAINEILKYADNPDVRTQLIFNFRVTGRFIRAVEDYTRRLVRYSTSYPDKVLYRLGHFSQAMDGTGLVYTDDNGVDYVLIPNDGIFWRTVAPALAAVMNPIGTASAVARREWDFFKQPAWNQYTLKLSLLNPAYAEGAGIPTLTGPTMAIPVLAARELLTKVGTSLDSSLVLKVADNIDNWLLGDLSDNTTWIRGVLPPNILNAWGALPVDMKTGATATALYQAAAYLQVNEKTGLKTEDYADEKKLGQYYDRLRLQAHNVVAAKLGFNILSPIPAGTTEPGIPAELRRVGIVSFRQEFSDILRGVLNVNATYGYNLEDPVGTAVSIFIAENPDKLIYTVSKNSKAAKTAINYTQETKNWAINNTKLIKDYPTASWAFAPRVGEYDPSVIYFLEAIDFIPEKQNVFDDDNSAFRTYLTDIAAVRDREKYFDVDRKVQELLNDPNNFQRNNALYRKDLLEKAINMKKIIMTGNLALSESLLNSEWTTRQTLSSRFNNFNTMINDVETQEALSKGNNEIVLANSKKMVALAQRMLRVFEDTKIRSQFNSEETLEKILREGTANLENLASTNLTLAHIYTGFIRPYIDDVYRVPTKALAKP